LKASFIPNKGDNFDQKSANKKEPEIQNYQEILQLVNKNKDFSGYYYNSKISNLKLDPKLLINPHDLGKSNTVKITHQTGYLTMKHNFPNTSFDVFSNSDISSMWLNKYHDEEAHSKDPFIREKVIPSNDASNEPPYDYTLIQIKPCQKEEL
jgi:hypothetical protein